VSERVAVVWDDGLAAYDFGPSHPLAPVRVELAYRLAGDLGLLQAPHCDVVPPAACDDALLRLVHSAD
jgi:acetoin utilization protein AcuC